MSRARSILAPAAALACCGSAAATVIPYSSGSSLTIPGPNAGTYQTLTPVALDTGALADDPSLGHFRVWDLQVSISAGDHWGAADVRAQLLGGATYYIPPANDSNTAPGTTLRTTVGTRYLN